METAKQNTQQNIEENDALKQFMGLLNRQGMGEQSQDFMELFQYVAGMQLQLAVMTDELQGVKEQETQHIIKSCHFGFYLIKMKNHIANHA